MCYVYDLSLFGVFVCAQVVADQARALQSSRRDVMLDGLKPIATLDTRGVAKADLCIGNAVIQASSQEKYMTEDVPSLGEITEVSEDWKP